jgi:enamine deaminase RidA (YjgF/YER057c/UK114 family)
MPDSRKVTIVPSFWADFYEETRIPAAVRVDDSQYLTGHTGTFDDATFPGDAESQIRQTFFNIATTLGKPEQTGPMSCASTPTMWGYEPKANP